MLSHLIMILLCAAFVGTACVPLSLRRSPSAAATAETVATAMASEEEAVQRYFQRRAAEGQDSQSTSPYIAVLPMADDSGFRRGIWNLPLVMAEMLSERLADYPDWEMVPHEVVTLTVAGQRLMYPREAVAWGAGLQADIVLQGTILDYNMSRFSAGDPLIGGYKSYNGVAQIQVVVLRVEDGAEIGRGMGHADLTDRDLGLDFLGKPRDQDLQFMNLGKMEFGSEEFKETVLGAATVAAMDQLVTELVGTLQPRDLVLHGRDAQILSVYDDEVYINVGSEHGVRQGFRFVVHRALDQPESGDSPVDAPVGLIEVIQVVGARLASVRVLQGADQIAPGDRLELLKRASGE